MKCRMPGLGIVVGYMFADPGFVDGIEFPRASLQLRVPEEHPVQAEGQSDNVQLVCYRRLPRRLRPDVCHAVSMSSPVSGKPSVVRKLVVTR